MVYVNDRTCNGCGECVGICPTGALVFQIHRAFIDQDLCQACEICLDVCPKGAILSGDWVPVSHEVIHVPEIAPAQDVPQIERAEPIALSEILLPAVGTILLWAGRDLMPRLANIALGYLDRKIESTPSILPQKIEMRSAGHLSGPTRQYGNGRRKRRRRKNRRFY